MTYAILDINGTVVDYAESAEEAIERSEENENYRAVESDRFGYWRSLTGESLYA